MFKEKQEMLYKLNMCLVKSSNIIGNKIFFYILSSRLTENKAHLSKTTLLNGKLGFGKIDL